MEDKKQYKLYFNPQNWRELLTINSRIKTLLGERPEWNVIPEAFFNRNRMNYLIFNDFFGYTMRLHGFDNNERLADISLNLYSSRFDLLETQKRAHKAQAFQIVKGYHEEFLNLPGPILPLSVCSKFEFLQGFHHEKAQSNLQGHQNPFKWKIPQVVWHNGNYIAAQFALYDDDSKGSKGFIIYWYPGTGNSKGQFALCTPEMILMSGEITKHHQDRSQQNFIGNPMSTRITLQATKGTADKAMLLAGAILHYQNN